MYKVLLTTDATKQIDKFDLPLKRRIKAAIQEIAKEPYSGKRLADKLRNYFSYRVSNYRIVYTLFEDKVEILIIALGHRKDVYKKLLRKMF